MLAAVNSILLAQSRLSLAVGLGTLVALVGFVDFVTGHDLSLSIFYVLPVAMASWYGRERLGFPFCFIAGLTMILVDFNSGHAYSYRAVPIWNAIARISVFLMVATLLLSLRRTLEAQAALAQRDGLTGLMNARTFLQECDALFVLAARHERPLAMAYLDVDNFKGINDSLGHNVGDEILKAIAATFKKRLRGSDLGARLGGDEFAIMLPETDQAGALKFFAGLHAGLVEVASRNGWDIGFSIGVAVYPHSAADARAAIRQADRLMYLVKNGNKNGILIETCGGESTKPPPEDCGQQASQCTDPQESKTTQTFL